MGYLLRIRDEKPEKIKPKNFEKERPLQEYVKKYPEIIPLEELDENFKPLLIIGREFSLENAGSVDLLAIDTQGLITLIEFKLEKNTDMRRVVAQTIEYAANLWEMTYDVFDEKIQAYFNSDRCEIEALKGKTLAQAVRWHFQRTKKEDEEEFSMEDFIKNVAGNLEKGEFRLIIFSDNADERIKRAVVYLNELSNFDIYCAATEMYEEKGEITFNSTFTTRDRAELSSRKKHAGKVTFAEFLESLSPQFNEFIEPYKTFDVRKNEVFGSFSMGTKGFAAYFSLREGKLKLFEGYPDYISLVTKNRFEKKIEETTKMPQGSLEDYQSGISKVNAFKSSFLSKGQWASYKYSQIRPSDLTQYFDFIIGWLKKWFFSEEVQL